MIRTVIWLLAWTTATTACASEFASEFSEQADQVWIGADYWANPMEDWAIQNGRLVCRGGGNRNVALLTRHVTSTGPWEMSVRFGQVQQGKATGTVGFRLGIQDEVEDYRAAALRGQGLDVGVDVRTRSLFIGNTTGGSYSKSESLEGWTLKVSGKPAGNQYTVVLTALDGTGKRQASIDATIPADRVEGLVALVNNHRAKDRPAFWFADWTLNGTGVVAHGDRAWGPILWTMHTMHRTYTDDGTVLKLTAQMALV